MKSKRHYKKTRGNSKKMRGGSKIRISYEKVSEMVKKAFEKIQEGTAMSQKAVISAIVLETLRMILTDPQSVQLAHLASSIVGSMFQYAITSIQLTATVTGSMGGTILSGISGVSSTLLESLVGAVTSAVTVCQANPIPATAGISAVATATIIKADDIRSGFQFTIENGLLNTITYVLFDLMIRSGYFEDDSYNPILLDINPNDTLQEAVNEIVEVASHASSQSSSQQSFYSLSQGSMGSDTGHPEITLPENANIDYATQMVNEMFAEIAELAKKRARDIDEELQAYQSDAESSKEICKRPAKRMKTTIKESSGGKRRRKSTKTKKRSVLKKRKSTKKRRRHHLK
jgi:hypothetical protein